MPRLRAHFAWASRRAARSLPAPGRLRRRSSRRAPRGPRPLRREPASGRSRCSARGPPAPRSAAAPAPPRVAEDVSSWRAAPARASRSSTSSRSSCRSQPWSSRRPNGHAEVDAPARTHDAQQFAQRLRRLGARILGAGIRRAVDRVVHADVLEGREADDLVEPVVAQRQRAQVAVEVGDAERGEGGGSGASVTIVRSSTVGSRRSTTCRWFSTEPASRTRPESPRENSHGYSTTRSSKPAPSPGGSWRAAGEARAPRLVVEQRGDQCAVGRVVGERARLDRREAPRPGAPEAAAGGKQALVRRRLGVDRLEPQRREGRLAPRRRRGPARRGRPAAPPRRRSSAGPWRGSRRAPRPGPCRPRAAPAARTRRRAPGASARAGAGRRAARRARSPGCLPASGRRSAARRRARRRRPLDPSRRPDHLRVGGAMLASAPPTGPQSCRGAERPEQRTEVGCWLHSFYAGHGANTRFAVSRAGGGRIAAERPVPPPSGERGGATGGGPALRRTTMNSIPCRAAASMSKEPSNRSRQWRISFDELRLGPDVHVDRVGVLPSSPRPPAPPTPRTRPPRAGGASPSTTRRVHSS